MRKWIFGSSNRYAPDRYIFVLTTLSLIEAVLDKIPSSSSTASVTDDVDDDDDDDNDGDTDDDDTDDDDDNDGRDINCGDDIASLLALRKP